MDVLVIAILWLVIGLVVGILLGKYLKHRS